jgi:alpha-1,2-mannosyltransferase
VIRAPRIPVAAGSAIAFAAMIKLYPAAMIYLFVVKRWWRGLIAFAAAVAGLTVFSVLVAGWEPQRHFAFDLLPGLKGTTGWLENQSLYGSFARLFVDGKAYGPNPLLAPHMDTVMWMGRVASLVVAGARALVLRRSVAAPHFFAVLVPVMILVVPAAWMHYQTVLLLPFAILLRAAFERPGAWKRLLLLAAFCLVAFGNHHTLLPDSTGLIQSYKSFGVLLLWITALLYALDAPREAAAPGDSRPA